MNLGLLTILSMENFAINCKSIHGDYTTIISVPFFEITFSSLLSNIQEKTKFRVWRAFLYNFYYLLIY